MGLGALVAELAGALEEVGAGRAERCHGVLVRILSEAGRLSPWLVSSVARVLRGKSLREWSWPKSFEEPLCPRTAAAVCALALSISPSPRACARALALSLSRFLAFSLSRSLALAQGDTQPRPPVPALLAFPCAA